MTADRIEDVVGVLCESFAEYPVMRYVIRASEYQEHLRRLIRFFVDSRVLRDEPVLGIEDGGGLVAAAIATLPGDRPPPTELSVLREDLWNVLGPAARVRYEEFGAAVGRLEIEEPHYHLNMVGVRTSFRGRRYARRLVEWVQDASARDPDSTGVTLSTELQQNVPLYEHLGYRCLGHASISQDLETWYFHRANTPDVRPSSS